MARAGGVSLQLGQHTRSVAFTAQLDEPAIVLARIRRRFGTDEYGSYLVQCAGNQLRTLDCMSWATAGELVHRGVDVGDALETVWARDEHLRSLLGEVAA